MTEGSFGWTDIDEIAIALYDAHPQLDPFQIKFTELRDLVEALPGFTPDRDHQVNEQILEAIQVAWQEEIDDVRDRAEGDDPGYSPNQPFR